MEFTNFIAMKKMCVKSYASKEKYAKVKTYLKNRETSPQQYHHSKQICELRGI